MVEVFGETPVMNDQRSGLMLTLMSDVSQSIPGNTLIRRADAKSQSALGRGMGLPPRSAGIARLKNRTEPTASHQDLIVPGIQAQQHGRDARWLLNPACTVIFRTPNQVSGFSDNPHPIGPPLHLDKIHQWGVLLGNRQIDALPSQAIDRVPELGRISPQPPSLGLELAESDRSKLVGIDRNGSEIDTIGSEKDAAGSVDDQGTSFIADGYGLKVSARDRARAPGPAAIDRFEKRRSEMVRPIPPGDPMPMLDSLKANESG